MFTKAGSKTLVATCITSIGLLAGCSLSPSQNRLEIGQLMLELGSCQFDDNERKAMYQAASAGNRIPFPLLICEGKRSDSFNKRWLQSRRAVDYNILGSHFEGAGSGSGANSSANHDGYGTALIEITMPDWGAACTDFGYDDTTCDHLVYGINAPHIDKVSAEQTQTLLRKQNKLAQITNIPVIKDTILMPLKHNAKGQLVANWVEDAGAQRTTKALADKLGETISNNGKPLAVTSYNSQYDLLQQKDLPAQYRGVFYYATPQYIDYSNRPAPQYAIPLRKGVQVRGYKTSIYRAFTN
ncbi:hypothetical protein JMA39_09530 [Shewanella schlegeliana]|uniref:Lipoprotein n=2 Tax=Shewanella schlegeliana TaxID=190308 RepID=A0ABS1SXV3_9GAMM|nr:hypothetical protein [Shewanella schlegeliana]